MNYDLVGLACPYLSSSSCLLGSMPESFSMGAFTDAVRAGGRDVDVRIGHGRRTFARGADGQVSLQQFAAGLFIKVRLADRELANTLRRAVKGDVLRGWSISLPRVAAKWELVGECAASQFVLVTGVARLTEVSLCIDRAPVYGGTWVAAADDSTWRQRIDRENAAAVERYYSCHVPGLCHDSRCGYSRTLEMRGAHRQRFLNQWSDLLSHEQRHFLSTEAA